MVAAELTEPFGQLLAEDLARQAQTALKESAALSRDGSNVTSLMELAGLEPATSWVRSRRSPN